MMKPMVIRWEEDIARRIVGTARFCYLKIHHREDI